MDEATCLLTTCDRPHKSRDRYCSMHRARITRHGDPDVTVAPLGRAMWCRWTPTPTYSAVHQRLRLVRGSARQHQCACGAQARQWSYDRTEPTPLLAPWPYSADLRRYVPRCVSCHKLFDLAAIR